MDGLADERFVLFGGPAGGKGKVVLVSEAPDEATIRARLARDPWSGEDVLGLLGVEAWTLWLPPRTVSRA